MSATNDFLAETVLERKFQHGFRMQDTRPRIVCNDGFSMSIQASSGHYCSPRQDYLFQYSAVEIGFPSRREELLAEYAETPRALTKTVYGYVPVEVVDAVIEKHGGIKTWRYR